MRLLVPTVDTKFHIDFAWWEKQNKDIRVFMRELLCPECRDSVTGATDTAQVDMVDPDTAEVTRVDAIWEAVRACCSVKPDFIGSDTPLLDSIFRVFVGNGNRALSVRELHAKLDKKPPDIILRMLTKGNIYLGIRPA